MSFHKPVLYLVAKIVLELIEAKERTEWIRVAQEPEGGVLGARWGDRIPGSDVNRTLLSLNLLDSSSLFYRLPFPCLYPLGQGIWLSVLLICYSYTPLRDQVSRSQFQSLSERACLASLQSEVYLLANLVR